MCVYACMRVCGCMLEVDDVFLAAGLATSFHILLSVLLSLDSQGLHCSSVSSINKPATGRHTHTHTHTSTHTLPSVPHVSYAGNHGKVDPSRPAAQSNKHYCILWYDRNTGEAEQDKLTGKHTLPVKEEVNILFLREK